MIIVVDNTTLQISCISVMRPKLRSPRKSSHLVEVVVDVAVDAVVDVVADAKVTARSGAMMRRIEIENIM